jgi:hypothetical protein
LETAKKQQTRCFEEKVTDLSKYCFTSDSFELQHLELLLLLPTYNSQPFLLSQTAAANELN